METILEKIKEYEKLADRYIEDMNENEFIDSADIGELTDAILDLLSISRALYFTVEEQKKGGK